MVELLFAWHFGCAVVVKLGCALVVVQDIEDFEIEVSPVVPFVGVWCAQFLG